MGKGGSCTSQGQGRPEALWGWDGMGSGPGGAGEEASQGTAAPRLPSACPAASLAARSRRGKAGVGVGLTQALDVRLWSLQLLEVLLPLLHIPWGLGHLCPSPE